MFTPLLFNILVGAYFPEHTVNILLGNTFMPTSVKRDCIARAKKVVALICKRAGVEDKAVAIKLQARRV